jgi:protein-S-isoprenylcysteine O-methyltransferase Ste14
VENRLKLPERRKDWKIVITQFVLSGLILVSGYYENVLMQRETLFPVYILSIVLIFGGIIGLLVTVFTFKQKITVFPNPRENAILIYTGIYSVIRHPMYLFFTLLIVGYCLYFNAYSSLILCLFLLLFFDYKITKEEMYLRQRFPEYTDYQKRTKKLIPYIY